MPKRKNKNITCKSEVSKIRGSLKMEKYVLVEYLSSLNKVIGETFKTTQRIKLTSFDVSAKYLIFGASSGGIYIFKRFPCEFLKIIPSKEGSTIQIKISGDEKNLAVASSRGVVVILEGFFTDLSLRPLVHNIHEGNAVTALEWHGNDLYCGDNTGKVSVFTITSLLTKAIFQTPSAVLMHLDSSIVQIDAYLHYLLISTKTRTYLCDTEQEQYKQIGKKLRDGHFGACFCQTEGIEILNVSHERRGLFKTVKEDEPFSSPLKNSGTKIYCARPGARLWEANFATEVLVTYQFKSSSEQSSTDLILITDHPDANLEITSCTQLENFNFGKIYPICKRFILTYDAEGVYFFDPITSSIPFWNSSFKNIIDVKISDKCIFIWRRNLQMNIISLQPLEDLILDILTRKQYYLCAEICVHYIENLLGLIETESRKICVILLLKDKLTHEKGETLLNKLDRVFVALEDYYKEQTLVKRIENGISIVDNKFLEQSENYLPETVQDFKTDEDLMKHKEDNKLSCLYKQYVLNKSHAAAELTECSKLLQSLSLDDAVLLLNDFVNYAKEEEAEDWCESQVIKLASGFSSLHDVEPKTLQYLSEIYLKRNALEEHCLKCKYPLPKSHLSKPKNYNLATMLYNRSEDKNVYLNSIPYLYKNYLTDLSDIKNDLPLLIQYNDKELIKQFMSKFNYDIWDDTMKLFLKLKQETCLNCSQKIDVSGIWRWTTLGMLIVESIGAKNAVRLLKRYAQYIPKGELDGNFYKCCFLTASYEESKLAVNFTENVLVPGNLPSYEEAVGKFLQKKYLGKEINAAVKNGLDREKCYVCRFSIKGPILNEFSRCSCGIYFHKLCIVDNKVCKNCLNKIV